MRMNYNFWKRSEIKYLKENYRKISVKQLADDLYRTQNSVRLKAFKLGISIANKNENHPNWVGNKIRYDGLHGWIKRHKPKPKFCEECKIKQPKDLANISGEYKRDINDFKWLCRTCHMKYDFKLKIRKSNKAKVPMELICLECNKQFKRHYGSIKQKFCSPKCYYQNKIKLKRRSLNF